ncbi:ATP-binding cassette domain-containing protein [Nonomuraea sp. KC401]|uniref:ABC transporter ATP-binding protein n=1 Tax=unclassified Nonomuraea TaxID=2593643 RepID=UPI0010FDBD05|nr:ATP-binding cassette domain-containing protein [Nonomuraea sp. KC401]NBE95941.1 ATP-binding cassette domain-containing protein [Nonomuraea sp. K271]TLF76261.1 ATP-binding cassette domain-containing protein [Nonomuraea sp. KC401]
MSVVRCDGIVQIYKAQDVEVVALRDVDLTIDAGETVALLGPSGAGKSTLLWLLAGLLRPSAGRLWMDGVDLGRLDQRRLDRLRATHIGMMLQNPARNLIGYLSAAQNITFAQRAAGHGRLGARSGSRPGAGFGSRRRARARARDLLARVGLADAGGRPAGRMSGGEQQRLALAVALANAPKLLLADEPTSQLDEESGARVIELIKDVAAADGTTAVVVTHDTSVSEALSRTVTIRDGRVGAEGRRGEDFVVVGREGAVQVPPEFHHLLPPGSMARIEELEDGIVLRRAEP